MKIKHFISRMMIGLVSFFLMTATQAGIPLWTFTPLTPTTISVSASGSAIIQYRITNQSRKSHTLVMIPIIGISQVTTAGNCSNPFTLSYQQSCTLTLQITGSALQGDVVGGPVVCQALPNGTPNYNQCYQPCNPNSLNITGQTTLTASVATLALKTGGIARIITITNTGTRVAHNVTYSPSPGLPAGTTITPLSCGTIVPGGTCVLTITPGATPSATPGNINPIPITLSIAGSNTNTLTPTLNILAYGSVYQSGYVFAFDDTTPNTGSIGGKVAALTDQAAPFPNGIIWSSDGSGNVAYNDIPGIYENSISPPCNGNIDGACNTGVIVAFYPGINLSFYAAGLCKLPNAGFTDWYLPAICELGYGTFLTGCGPAGAPTIQNMQSNLVDYNNSDIGSLSGKFYWSSTEFSGFALVQTWFQNFETGGTSSQFTDDKAQPFAVRCARTLTP